MTCWKLLAHKISAPLTILTGRYFAFRSCFYQLDYPKFVGNLKYLGMNNSQRWMNEGYDLFAREGPEGIQVERLARVLGLNKSGFYHHFGDRNTYLASTYVEMSDQPELALRYFRLIRDVVYARINFDNFTPEFLRIIVSEAKAIMEESIRHKRLSLYSQQVKSEFFSFISGVS